jgi:hypothetical protein
MSRRLSSAWLLPFTWLYSFETMSISFGTMPTPRSSPLVGIIDTGLFAMGVVLTGQHETQF